MMKRKKFIVLLAAIMLLIVFQACEKDDENETNISSYSSDDSHKAGQNCMTCHKSGGEGEGWFIVAGTVYDNTQTSVYPNATVKLFSSANGTGDLIKTIEVDQNGNFYTTEQVDFGTGLYVAVEGTSNTKYMSSSIASGSCNSCHGVSVDPIWVN